MTLELCNGIIVLEEATMLHDTDAKFAIIDSAIKAKKGASTDGTGTKKVPQYLSTRYCPPLYKIYIALYYINNVTTFNLLSRCFRASNSLSPKRDLQKKLSGTRLGQFFGIR